MVEAVGGWQSGLVPNASRRNPATGVSNGFSGGLELPAASADRVKADPTVAPPASAPSQDNSGADDFRHLFANSLPPAVPFSAANPPLPYGYPTPAGAAASSNTGPAPFVPTFQNALVTDGVNSWNLNHDYFATKDTAQWIANKYGTGQVISTPFEGSGGPFNANQTEFQIVLHDGRTVNAGILAGYYERNPESQFPGLADTLIRGQLGLAAPASSQSNG